MLRDGHAELLSPAELAKRAPLTWQYLQQNRKELERRERGRFRGDAWYQYGRTQALEVVGRPKLLTADLAKRMAFSLDSSGELHLLGGAAGGYGLLPARQELFAPLLALLNSKLLEWMLRPPGLSSPFRGGWFSCEARFINLLPIRLPENPQDLRALGELAERAVEAYRRRSLARADRDRALHEREIEALESEMDDRSFKLYEVTKEERRTIQETLEEARAESCEGAQDAGQEIGDDEKTALAAEET